MNAIDYNIIRREGKRLIKYQLNVADTKHLFCYLYNGRYYSFIMFNGLLVDINDRVINSDKITGSKTKGKYFEEYYNSSLNQYFNTTNNN